MGSRVKHVANRTHGYLEPANTRDPLVEEQGYYYQKSTAPNPRHSHKSVNGESNHHGGKTTAAF